MDDINRSKEQLATQKQAIVPGNAIDFTLREILDVTPFPIALVDVDDDVIHYWSQSALNLFGHLAPTAQEWYNIAYPDPQYRSEVIQRWKQALKRAQDTGDTVNAGVYRIACKDGSYRFCELFAAFSSGRLIVTFHDITAQIQAEQVLIENELLYRHLIETASDAIYLISEHGQIVRSNQAAAEMLGRSLEEVLTLTIDEIDPNFPLEAFLGFWQNMPEEMPQMFETTHKRKDGQLIPIEIHGAKFRLGDRTYYYGIARNITERKCAENKLKMALADKEVLLQELYHRTKNNMQIIIGLINLQASKSDDETVLSLYKGTISRILSMNLVHKKLYESQNLSSVDLGDYIRDLMLLLADNNRLQENEVNLIYDMETIPVLIDIAIPCGLIINEIVTNVFKHAFQDTVEGQLRITLKRLENGDVFLQIADNGIGLPSGFDPKTSTGIGMQTIMGIAKYQLKGSITCDSDHGVIWTLIFGDKHYQSAID